MQGGCRIWAFLGVVFRAGSADVTGLLRVFFREVRGLGIGALNFQGGGSTMGHLTLKTPIRTLFSGYIKV